MKLRPYQESVLQDLWGWMARNGTGDPIVEACVGAGKSLMIAEWCRGCIEAVPGTRILMLVHTKELVSQNLDKLLRIWPTAPAGVHSASLRRHDVGQDIMYATIGSVYRKAHLLGRVDMILVDECHLISGNEASMYRTLIAKLREYNPALRVIGWTGTAFRGDGLWLRHHGLFAGVAARVSMRELLDQGYLVPLVSAPTEQIIDTEGVRIQAGDYVISGLAKAAMEGDRVERACKEIIRLAADRKSWLIFAVNVAHAEAVNAALRSLGVASNVVHQGTSAGDRDDMIEDYKAGRLRALVNVGVLTTGFDAPGTDCIALLRPTKSPVLYVQIAGRGMRCVGQNAAESAVKGKSDCLWLDFTSTTADLGPVDQVKGRNPAPPGRAPFRYCEECGAECPTSALNCHECGAALPPPAEPKAAEERHSTTVSTAKPIAVSRVDHKVSTVEFDRHPSKRGGPDTLKVEYWSGFRVVVREFLCFDHPAGSFPKGKAQTWWRDHGGALPAPASVSEALGRTHELEEVEGIEVDHSGEWPTLVGVTFVEVV